MDRILFAGKATVGAAGIALALVGLVSFAVVVPETVITWSAIVAAVSGGVAGLLTGGA